MIKKDVISICNILADKMSESGKVAIQQIVAAIEDMEEESCEDCISREQTLKAFTEKCVGECACCKYNGSDNGTAENCKLIKSMPSVTSTRPKGKWIHWTDDYKDYVTCSCCEYGEEGEVLLSDKTPFCPICGAEMEVEE